MRGPLLTLLAAALPRGITSTITQRPVHRPDAQLPINSGPAHAIVLGRRILPGPQPSGTREKTSDDEADGGDPRTLPRSLLCLASSPPMRAVRRLPVDSARAVGASVTDPRRRFCGIASQIKLGAADSWEGATGHRT